MTWYLVMASLYIGPFEEAKCKAAAQLVGVFCKQADYVYSCAMTDIPGSVTVCPHFSYPAVTSK